MTDPEHGKSAPARVKCATAPGSNSPGERSPQNSVSTGNRKQRRYSADSQRRQATTSSRSRTACDPELLRRVRISSMARRFLRRIPR
jgi:hypothetical protein